MAELVEVAELVKVAVEDEKSGVAFYSKLAETSQKLKKTFSELAAQEKVHQKRFEEMLAQLGSHAPREQYPGEYTDYLQTLTSTRAFPDEQAALRAAEQCADDAAAVDLASRFERDTLILMNEMRSMVPPKHKDLIDELTREEQEHLVTLTQARREL